MIGVGVDSVAVVSIAYDPDPSTTPDPIIVPDPSVMTMMDHGTPVPAIGAVGFQDPVAVGLVTVGAVGAAIPAIV